MTINCATAMKVLIYAGWDSSTEKTEAIKSFFLTVLKNVIRIQKSSLELMHCKLRFKRFSKDLSKWCFNVSYLKKQIICAKS